MNRKVGRKKKYLCDVARSYYTLQRRLFFKSQGRKDIWKPPSPNGIHRASRAGVSFYSFSEKLILRGYNPLQVIRFTFEDYRQRGLNPPHCDDVGGCTAFKEELNRDAKLRTEAFLNASLAKVERAQSEVDFMVDDGGAIDPAILGANLDPVVSLSLTLRAGIPVSKPLALQSKFAYLTCPTVYKDLFWADLPDNIKKLPTYEELFLDHAKA